MRMRQYVAVGFLPALAGGPALSVTVTLTDFSLSWCKLVEPGLGEPFTMTIDVTESVRRLLTEGASFAGFVLSCSLDGEFCLASVDLIDDIRGKVYLPKLVLQTSLQ